MTPSCDAHDGYVPGCRACLTAWLNRPRPGILSRSRWDAFEPERCAVVEAGNGFRAVRVETSGPLDLAVKKALTGDT